MAHTTRGLSARIIREGAGDECVFVAEHGFYCYMTATGNPVAVLQVVLQKVSQGIASEEFEQARDVEEAVLEYLSKAGAPEGASIACMLEKHGVLYLVTRGRGEIYIQRGGNTVRLLDKERHAAGQLKDDDVFILTTSASSSVISELGGWSAYLGGKEITGQDFSGLILTTGIVEAEEEEFERRAKRTTAKRTGLPKLVATLRSMNRKRLASIGALLVVGVLLVVSVAVGFVHRANDERLKQIAYTKEEVVQKLKQAEDVAFLNSGRAAGLINDAKQDVSELKKQTGDSDSDEVKELDELIAQAEAAIFKKEERQPEEFFDLGIENKEARGILIARSENRAAILNPDGSVYLLDLEKKSLDRYSSGVKNATGLAVGDSSVFVLNTDGVVQVGADGKAKKVINKDGWGRVSAIASFNNNIYLLDEGTGDIHKYVPAEDGYSKQTSYLEGDPPNLAGTKSIAIDSSVYVAGDSIVYKFTSGLQDGFAPQFPEGPLNITKVLSADDVEKVYAWDKPNGLMYVVSKSGSYERQIKSAALKSADDVLVAPDGAYALEGQKIYKISLE